MGAVQAKNLKYQFKIDIINIRTSNNSEKKLNDIHNLIKKKKK